MNTLFFCIIYIFFLSAIERNYVAYDCKKSEDMIFLNVESRMS